MGIRGNFYHPEFELNIPIHLGPDVAAFMNKLAREKAMDIEKIVNDWLRKNIGLIESVS